MKQTYRDFSLKQVSKRLSVMTCHRSEFLVVEADNRTEIPEHLEKWAKDRQWRLPYEMRLLDRRKTPFPGADYPLVVTFKG